MKLRSFLWGTFWALVGLALVFHVAGGWYFSNVLIEDAFVPAPATTALPGGDFELEEVEYQSPLGRMEAWYLPADSDVWVIHVHGKGATPAEAEHLFGPLQEAGYQQLAITYRNDEGAPLDPSGYYQYGDTEWEDVDGAVEYARANGADRIVLSGLSTGASHVMSFMFHRSLDDVAGLVFDAPNIDMSDTVDYGASQRALPLLPWNVPPTLSAMAKFITSLRIGVNWKAIDYIDKADLIIHDQVLVHHGEEDLTVPVSQSVRFAEARPSEVHLIRVEGAGHVESYDVAPEEYVAEVLGFLGQFG